jgi:hypothetical protein
VDGGVLEEHKQAVPNLLLLFSIIQYRKNRIGIRIGIKKKLKVEKVVEEEEE